MPSWKDPIVVYWYVRLAIDTARWIFAQLRTQLR